MVKQQTEFHLYTEKGHLSPAFNSLFSLAGLKRHRTLKASLDANQFSYTADDLAKVRDQVQALFDAVQMDKIEDYCLGDVFDTYFVFLRWKVVRGQISLEQEAYLVKKAHEAIKAHEAETGFLKDYLKNFAYWQPVD